MNHKLTDSLCKKLPSPAVGNKIHYDTDVKGLGLRVTAAGARSFILTYRTRGGRERRYTIGRFPDWSVSGARQRARELKRRIADGADPLADLEADRDAPSVADLCQRYVEDRLPRKRPSSQRNDRSMIEREILPAMRHLKVNEITFSDIDGLHRRITRRGARYAANRVVALLSNMFQLAVRWQWRTDNPCRGVERNQEEKRKRYLSPKELGALTDALASYEDQQATNIIRLLLLTGARRSEVQLLRWDQIDFESGTWTKPGATTKQKTEHSVPLSAPALQLLSALRAQASDAERVFPGPGRGGHRENMKTAWKVICRAAGVKGCRLHDLRHTYASLMVSAGFSLPTIGALLGHTQVQTTHRYAHLIDDHLRQATERVGAIVVPTQEAEVVKLRR